MSDKQLHYNGSKFKIEHDHENGQIHATGKFSEETADEEHDNPEFHAAVKKHLGLGDDHQVSAYDRDAQGEGSITLSVHKKDKKKSESLTRGDLIESRLEKSDIDEADDKDTKHYRAKTASGEVHHIKVNHSTGKVNGRYALKDYNNTGSGNDDNETRAKGFVAAVKKGKDAMSKASGWKWEEISKEEYDRKKRNGTDEDK